MPKEENTKKEDIHGEVDGEHYAKAVSLKEQRGFQAWGKFLENLIDQTPSLSPELLKKIGNVFIDGTIPEKLNFVVNRYLEINEKFPYLTTQGKEITPESAGFPYCPFIEVVYWNNKLIGFSCMSIKPLAFKLHTRHLKMPKGSTSMIESLTFLETTSELCWRCVTLLKQAGTGVGLKGLPTLEQIERHRMQMNERKEREEKEANHQLALLEVKRHTSQEVKELFNILHYNPNQQKWKGKAKASRLTGISRTTIDKILKAYPKGIR